MSPGLGLVRGVALCPFAGLAGISLIVALYHQKFQRTEEMLSWWVLPKTFSNCLGTWCRPILHIWLLVTIIVSLLPPGVRIIYTKAFLFDRSVTASTALVAYWALLQAPIENIVALELAVLGTLIRNICKEHRTAATLEVDVPLRQ